jgi:hypothetical protein
LGKPGEALETLTTRVDTLALHIEGLAQVRTEARLDAISGWRFVPMCRRCGNPVAPAESEQTTLLGLSQDMLRNMGSRDRAATTEARPVIDVDDPEVTV